MADIEYLIRPNQEIPEASLIPVKAHGASPLDIIARSPYGQDIPFAIEYASQRMAQMTRQSGLAIPLKRCLPRTTAARTVEVTEWFP